LGTGSLSPHYLGTTLGPNHNELTMPVLITV